MDLTSLLWTILFTAVLLIVFRWIVWRTSRRLAPGPWGLPFLGYLPFLSPVAFQDYLKLKDKYGKIFALRLGMKYTVVLNDFAAIKESFNKEEFTNKPPDWFRIYPESDSLTDLNGKPWKEARRFTMSTLRNLGMGKNKVEEAIKEEISVLTEKLSRAPPDEETNVYKITNVHFLNVILTMLFGRTYKDGDRLVEIMEDYNIYLSQKLVANQKTVYFPILKLLRWFQNYIPEKKIPAVEEVRDFVRDEIRRHQNEFDENNINDYISYYLLDINQEMNNHTSITGNNLMANAEIMLFAATDSTRTALSWIFVYLAKYGDHQEQIHQEIVDLLGQEKPPSWSDKDSLPLTNAFILEVFRYQTPSETVHWSSKESVIGGFCVPENSLVIANVEAVHKDPKLWGDPENFRPSRFLTPDGKRTFEPEYLMPFIIGKRVCPGLKLANMQLFLFTASLLQKFRVLPPKSGLEFQLKYEISVAPTKPIVTFQRRT